MLQLRKYLILALCAVVMTAAVANGSVTQKQMSEMKLSGPMKVIAKLFGWDGPRYTVEYYQGHQMRTDYLNDKGEKVERSEIVDLDKELFISVNHKKKRYSQMTFAEWREMMRKAVEDMKAQMPENSGEGMTGEGYPELSYNFNIDHTGSVEDINGFQAEKVIVTATSSMAEDAAAQGDAEAAAMVVEMTTWVVEELYGTAEMAEFAKLLVEKLGMDPEVEDMKNMLEMVFVSNPAAGGAMSQISEAQEQVGGHSVKTIVKIKNAPAAESESEAEAEEESGGGSGLFGKLGGKFMGGGKKDKDQGPAVLIETHSERFAIDDAHIDPSMFAPPEKYKLEKK